MSWTSHHGRRRGYQGTALATRERFTRWFIEAGLPAPMAIDLVSGASLFVAERFSMVVAS
jgi:hypothetical protein